MASITIRNLPDEVHRALRLRAAQRGRSTEAEIRSILEQAAKPEGRLKLGSLLASIAREAGGLTETEADHFDRLRDRTPPEPARFEPGEGTAPVRHWDQDRQQAGGYALRGPDRPDVA